MKHPDLKNSLKNLITFLVLFSALNLSGQNDIRELVKKQSALASRLTFASEGFGSKLSGEDITYHSTRTDCPLALLVRATNGIMAIEWESGLAKPDSGAQEACFFLITGMSQKGYAMNSSEPGFSVFVNGHPYFHFNNHLGLDWTSTGPDNSRMVFNGFITDQYGDSFGYTTIYIPVSELDASGRVRFRIVGDKAGSQHWFMVFQCPDGLAWFNKKAKSDNWFELDMSEDNGRIEAALSLPASFESLHVTGSASNGWKGNWTMKPEAGHSIGVLHLKGQARQWDSVRMTIRCGNILFADNVQLYTAGESSDIRPELIAFYSAGLVKPGEWKLDGKLIASSISKDLETISKSELSRGKFHIMASSHQDIAWMDSPEACKINRDVLLITPALKQLQENPGYFNDMEDILMLREYLERHPDKKKEIYDLTLQGKLTWGASYIQPYEEMYFGEPLIRQFYFGRKWFRHEFPGCDSRIYWNVDVPGRTLQMPQILAKSGVDYMIISRHDKGLFNWAAPDGSKVLTYSPDHYYNSYTYLKQGFFETVTHLADLTSFWDKYYSPSIDNTVMPVLSDADMALPDSYFDYIRTWESLSASRIKNGWKLPRLVHSTAERFMDEAFSTGIQFPTITGERPDVWLYIHGPSHFEALRYGRSSGRTLPAAEKLASMRSVIDGSWDSYPAGQLAKAWESAIYPDHGWGGNQGAVTDSTFLAKFREADSIAGTVIRISAETLASQIDFKEYGIPLVVFNTLSWERTDPVRLSVKLPDKEFRHLKLMDPEGREVPIQIIGSPEYYPSGLLKKAEILFISDKVPSTGFRTYYLSAGIRSLKAKEMNVSSGGVIETPYYRIRLETGGQASLYDKNLGREVWNADQFMGGELFTMRSIGNGAGEFSDIQQPDMDGFERMAHHADRWQVEEDGPLMVKISTIGTFRHNKARIAWMVYKTIKRLDISIDLIDWDGTAYREFRLAFPASLDDPEISYEVPFGVVRVGRDELQHPAGERYKTPCAEVHPRGINNWISASDEHLGITLSSSVAVWDYINMTNLPTDALLLQPILLASRQSCHPLGPLYHQTGSHTMVFSLFTHQPGWQNGYKQALQANDPLITVFNPESSIKKILPEIYSFLEIDDANSIISTIKKEEDGNGLIIRIFDMEGKDKNVNLRTGMKFGKAFKTDLLEEHVKEIPFSGNGIPLKLSHHSIETVLLTR